MAKQRIGILGGLFDPIHQVHISMAQIAADTLNLDQVLVIPFRNTPHKSCDTPADDRWRMAVFSCAFHSKLIPSDIAIACSGPFHAIDALNRVHGDCPKADLFWIIGDEDLKTIRQWPHLDEVLSLCSFLVFPGSDTPGKRETDNIISEMISRGGSFLRAAQDAGTVSGRTGTTFAADPLSVAVREYCTCRGLYGLVPRVERAGSWIGPLFSSLKPKRFAHSLSVAETARQLAVRYHLDPVRAEAAGILHDCAKCLPLHEMQELAVTHSLTDDPYILDSASLLHSVAGAYLAREKYGMTDPEILSAITYHNTGFPGMSPLDMCVCLADFMEPLRKSFPLLERVRSLASYSLEKALLLSLEGTAEYVISEGNFLHPRTENTIAWLRQTIASSDAAPKKQMYTKHEQEEIK